VKELALICGLLSGVIGVGSAIAFLKGSKGMPWDMQTWSGETEAEKAFQANAERWNRIGLVCLIVAFGLSALAAIAGYFS